MGLLGMRGLLLSISLWVSGHLVMDISQRNTWNEEPFEHGAA